MIDLLAAAFPGRGLHVVADVAYRSPTWRQLSTGVTFTIRLAATAALYAPAPPRTGKRGRPALKGAKLGKPADLAEAATWTTTTVKRYGHTHIVQLAVIA
jgi:hypothetical protein